MKANTKKKNSAMKKLIPAAGMLAISASMLATSTYAWFTMSREVEVKNIQMTATVPEDLQISLGAVTGGTLQASTGTLTRSTTTTEPHNTGASTDNPDWNNTADISSYYIFGNLIPASSTTGESLFFTPDATGDGSTVKDGAAYYDALASGGMATLHAKTSGEKTKANNDKWEGYTKQAGYAVANTNDDGYYIDIPVWFRTSATGSDVKLTVQAFAKRDADSGATAADPVSDGDLYKAVRVAIIQTTGTGESASTSTNMIAVADGAFNGDTVYDWANKGSADAKAVSSASGDYDTPTVYNSGATTAGTTAVVTVTKATDKNYGPSVPATIRVWLEGEDQECINPNAAQDWDISLKFSKIESN